MIDHVFVRLARVGEGKRVAVVSHRAYYRGIKRKLLFGGGNAVVRLIGCLRRNASERKFRFGILVRIYACGNRGSLGYSESV